MAQDVLALIVAFQWKTADLDAGVAALDLEVDFEFEVVEFAAFPDEEGVALGGFLRGGLAGDDTVLDAPEFGIAVPMFKRLAIEQGLEIERIGPCGSGDRECGEQ
jgi:hypothetical protein